MLKKIKLSAKEWIESSQKRFAVDNSSVPKRLTMCKKCNTFYYKNAWHFEKPAFMELERDEEIPVRFTECPACIELEEALYESETEFAWRRI